MTAIVCHGDARSLQLPDESVDLVCTSPPYFGLRDYGYTDQLGSEATPQEYIAALVECTREMARVLKPSGSIWINLGDKFSGAAGPKSGVRTFTDGHGKGGRWPTVPRGRGVQAPPKSLLLLPHRFAIACMDELGLIVRQDQVWSKPSSLPESVVDRTRRAHEYFFHLVKQPRYYSAVDEIREPHDLRYAHRRLTPQKATTKGNADRVGGWKGEIRTEPGVTGHPLGKLPGSVWSIPAVPLKVPAELGADHFAAYPPALVRPIITGWCPREVCTACGEGRRPVAERASAERHNGGRHEIIARRGAEHRAQGGNHGAGSSTLSTVPDYRITGYACACPDTSAPSTPGVVLDPFGGTGTTALVADVLGRVGISLDASTDYCRIARWRTTDPVERARAAGNDTSHVARVEPTQGELFAEDAS